MTIHLIPEAAGILSLPRGAFSGPAVHAASRARRLRAWNSRAPTAPLTDAGVRWGIATSGYAATARSATRWRRHAGWSRTRR